ncbi:MAG: hypothetical protein WAS27_02055 [Candidatus Saccharimonadales bacterium]
MAKQKKKRNKSYTGVDATTSRPSITRVSAVSRNPLHQWWVDHKRIAKPVLIAAGVLGAIVVLILEIIRLASGA